VIPGNEDAEDGDARHGDPKAARKKAMDFLARREYGQEELVAKLVGGGFEPDIARAAVERLAGEGLQDDRRFAAGLVQSRIGQGKGPVRIRQELEQRGIDAGLIEAALAESGEDWTGLARRVRRRRFGTALPPDFPAKARQMRFLQYRGFTAEQVQAAVAPNDDL
jgi:regulatory protein